MRADRSAALAITLLHRSSRRRRRAWDGAGVHRDHYSGPDRSCAGEQGEPGEEAIIGGVRRRRRSDLVEHTTRPEYLRTGRCRRSLRRKALTFLNQNWAAIDARTAPGLPGASSCESRANGLVGVVPEGEVGGEEHARSEGKGAGRGASGFRGGPFHPGEEARATAGHRGSEKRRRGGRHLGQADENLRETMARAPAMAGRSITLRREIHAGIVRRRRPQHARTLRRPRAGAGWTGDDPGLTASDVPQVQPRCQSLTLRRAKE